MKNQAAPMTTENISKVIRLYLAIELSRKKWKLGHLATGGEDGRGSGRLQRGIYKRCRGRLRKGACQ